MVRIVLETALPQGLLDEVFQRSAQKQYLRELLFSSLVGLMCQVVCGIRRSICEAYHQGAEKIAVSLTSVYNKLKGVEDAVSEAMVRAATGRLMPVVRLLANRRAPLLRGYDTRIVDGNHLPSTQHRLKVLRRTRSGPLPGQSLVVYDPALGMIVDVFVCQDAHAQERSLIPRVLAGMRAAQLWIADRNFCTTGMLFGIVKARAFFVIRQHASTLTWRALGKPRPCGRAVNGRLFEQKVELEDPQSGQKMTVRRVTLRLDRPTSKGEDEIDVLTNLPKKDATAAKVMELYRERWTIEQAFHELERELQSEIDTLGYPQAALFGFCVSLVAYNALQVVKAALAAAHGVEEAAKISGYYLGTEIASTYAGMMLAIEPRAWGVFATVKPRQLATVLKELARSAELERYGKHRRGPKKPRPFRTSGKRHKHVATARLLAQQNVARAP